MKKRDVVRMGIALALAASVVAAERSPPPAANPPVAAEKPSVIVVVGSPGEPEFAAEMARQAEGWQKVSERAGATFRVIGLGGANEQTDQRRLAAELEAESKGGRAELWLVLVGHGTFDGKEAKFNLRGPDLSADDLAAWLKPFQRPIAVIDTASSSAPFLAKIAAPNRVVITATRSGYEHNYARLGKFLAEAMGDPRSDLDKDGQISLLEAFLTGSHRTTEFYKTEGRLATEHALLDDNGDGLGTPPDWFKGVRAIKRARDGAALDGIRAHQFHLVRSAAEQQLPPEARARRDQLELELSKLREQKPKMPEDAYYRDLERLLLELAAVYERT